MMKRTSTISLVAFALWLAVGFCGAITLEIRAAEPKQSPKSEKDEKTSPSPKTSEPKKTTSASPKNTSTPSETGGDNKDAANQSNSDPNNSTGGGGGNSGGWLDSIWNLLWWLLVGIAVLLVLGGVGYLIYYILNAISAERQASTEGFNGVRSKHREFQHQIEQLEKTVKLQSGQFTQLQTSLQALQRQILELGGRDVPQQMSFTPTVAPPEPQFPTAAEDYRNKVRHNAQTATADLIGGRLVSDENKGNEFLIVRDGELSDGQFYAVPNQIRFSAKSDYLSYYQNYYYCENPSSGAIWIKSPAIVRRVENGWTLEKMGELEVR